MWKQLDFNLYKMQLEAGGHPFSDATKFNFNLYKMQLEVVDIDKWGSVIQNFNLYKMQLEVVKPRAQNRANFNKKQYFKEQKPA